MPLLLHVLEHQPKAPKPAESKLEAGFDGSPKISPECFQGRWMNRRPALVKTRMMDMAKRPTDGALLNLLGLQGLSSS